MNSENDTESFLLRRSVQVIDKAVLETLDTPVLLKRLKKLQKCMKTTDGRDLTEEQISDFSDRILVKTDPRWQLAYDDVKSILVTREHVQRPGEVNRKRKTKRKRKIKTKRAPKASSE